MIQSYDWEKVPHPSGCNQLAFIKKRLIVDVFVELNDDNLSLLAYGVKM